ncbi:MAG: hypothetical protein ACYS0G_16585 [Planctomycetota bacterium]|jgi:hypothetical protein
MRVPIIVVCLIPLLATGCGSKKQQASEPVVSVPLELDPTEDYELPAWWTNDEQLLHLDEAGRYALYDGLNRYHEPAERGQWWKHSYAAIRLEPYAALSREATRGTISRIDQALRLSLPGLEPMMGLEGPPPVVEDRLVGLWTAEFGTLRLRVDGRYVYSAIPARTRPPATMAGHGGAWRVEDDTIVLRPDSPRMEPVLVRIRETDDAIFLESRDGQLTRQVPIVEGG